MLTSSTPAEPQEDYELLLPQQQPEQQSPMGQEEQWTKPEGRNGDLTAKYAALGATATTLVTTWFIVLSNRPFEVGWFALHPLLQTLAMSLFTYGILTLQPTSQPKTKTAGLLRHQIAMLYLALPFITGGAFAVFYNKILHGKDHFVSWHGTIGIICMAWIILQVGIGGGSVWFGGAAFGGGGKAKAIWKYHRLSGYILFPMLLLTVNLGGAWTSWGKTYSVYPVRLVAYTVAPAVILVSILVRMRLSKMKFS